jgi:type VI secretion system protein ImpG
MFKDDYQSELEYLQRACDELGAREPDLAPMLGRGTDPSVTRLLEGLAFTFARLRQRLDDDMPEIVHPVVENLCPELLRPIPSATVVELVPSPKLLGRKRVPAGTSFAARARASEAPCYFRSTVDVDVGPWTLRRVDLIGAERRMARLTLDLLPGATLADTVPETLEIFLAQPIAVSLEVRHFLLAHVDQVSARSVQSEQAVLLPRPVARERPRSLSRALPMADAFLLLRDYFTFPHRFAFVTFPGFDAVRDLGQATQTIELDLTFDEPLPRGLTLETGQFALHAVPASNLFRPPAVSLPLRGDKRSIPLRFDGDLEGTEVFSLEGATLVSRGLRRTSLTAAGALLEPRPTSAPLGFELRRAPSVIGTRHDVGLTLTGERLDEQLDDQVSIEVDVWLTQGERAAQVELGAVSVPTASSPSLMTFRNVTQPTRPLPPSLSGDRLWRFYRLSKTGLGALIDLESLGAALALANVPAHHGHPDAKPDAERFAPLLDVRLERGGSSDRDRIHAGAKLRVTLDVRRFSGPGDVRLFGEVLLPLVAATLTETEWVELEICDAKGTSLERYPRTRGERHGF